MDFYSVNKRIFCGCSFSTNTFNFHFEPDFPSRKRQIFLASQIDVQAVKTDQGDRQEVTHLVRRFSAVGKLLTINIPLIYSQYISAGCWYCTLTENQMSISYWHCEKIFRYLFSLQEYRSHALLKKLLPISIFPLITFYVT